MAVKTIKQNIQISICGNNLKSEVIDLSVSMQADRLYNTAQVVVDTSVFVEDGGAVKIILGDFEFLGFVHYVSKQYQGRKTLYCRTYSAKLFEPYSVAESVTEDFTDTHTLFTQYCSDIGVTVTPSTINISFGSDFVRDEVTKGSAFMSAAGITGARVLERDGGIAVIPRTGILDDGVAIPRHEYEAAYQQFADPSTKRVGTVVIDYKPTLDLIGSSDGFTTISSPSTLMVEIDSVTADMTVFVTPPGLIAQEQVSGAKVATKQSYFKKTFDRDIIDTQSVDLGYPIHSIITVTVNGFAIGGYSFAGTTLAFEDIVTGSIHVEFVTVGVLGKAIERLANNGTKFVDFIVTYLDLRSHGYAVLDDTAAETGGSFMDENTGVSVIYPDETDYVKGFDIYTIGHDPVFRFWLDGEEVERPVVTEPAEYFMRQRGIIEYQPDEDTFAVRLRYDPNANGITYVRSSGRDVPYTTFELDERTYVKLEDTVPDIEIGYGVDSQRTHIQFPKTDGILFMQIYDAETGLLADEQELSLIDNSQRFSDKVPVDYTGKIDDTFDFSDPYDPTRPEWDGTIPDDLEIDIAGLLGKKPSNVSGKELAIRNPIGSTSTETVKRDGFLTLHITMAGNYKINLSPIITGAIATVSIDPDCDWSE
jgi:hypothetical protein